tara:strand:+ start:65 stop:397 length:333 start_codon:yes stop_codon:yes gene_type:complete
MRYKRQRIFTNEERSYKRFLKERGLDLIHQYNTPNFRYPSNLEFSNFNIINHIWSTGDRYFKLAEEYYDDPKLWWILAFFNQKPTEFDINYGDVIYIPTPLEKVLFHIGY